ncbi:hypothetical protein MFERI15568_00523 [Mycoplasma feriruminatoris]|uniref:hypothetical protein n=1 Tax=Mycoplasma feriruminatoris TaxID=1179777 RepID=UPI00241E3404|nr:hypothetical protein [Mycoplasma feriruminatoris]WFQ96089.1 hypothetical protein MFERI15568_00523 [Mycoplasma feriruminatoris]
MKKLLRVLAIFGFATMTTGSVIACTKQKPQPKKPDQSDTSDSNTDTSDNNTDTSDSNTDNSGDEPVEEVIDPNSRPDSDDNEADDNDINDNASQIRQKNDLIQQFNSEIRDVYNETIRPYINSRTAILSRRTDDSEDFFARQNFSKLSKKIDPNKDNDGYQKFYDNLDEKEQSEFNKSLENVLDISTAIDKFKQKLNKLGTDKYRILLNGFNDNNWIKGIKFRFDDSKMKFFENKDSFDSTIKLVIDFSYQYKDTVDQVKNETISNELVINVSSEEVVIDLLKNIKKLWSNLLLSNDDLLKVDFETLKKASKDLTVQDLLTASTNSYKSAISKHNEELSEKIKDKILEKLIKSSGNEVVKNFKISYKDDQEKIDSEKSHTKLKIGALEQETLDKNDNSVMVGLASAYDQLHLYFGEVKTDEQIDLLKTKNGNKQLVEELLDPWIAKMQNYKDQFKQTLLDTYSEFNESTDKLEEQFKNSDIFKNMYKTVTSIENFELQGLCLTLASGFVHDLGNISFNYAVELEPNDSKLDFDNTEELKEKTYKQSSIFNAYYKGIETLLIQFHKFYGIKKGNPDYSKKWIPSISRRLLFNMTGRPKNVKTRNNEDFNIWFEWKKYLNGDGKKTAITTDLSEFYSLDFNSDVKKNKEEYLISKIPGITEFKLFQTRNPKQTICLEEQNYNSRYLVKNSKTKKLDWVYVPASKGIVANKSGAERLPLEFGMQTDLFNWKLTSGSFFSYHLSDVTMIGNIEEQADTN